MKAIQMVDLSSQYQKLKPRIDAAMQQVIDACAFIKGPFVEKFEAELAHYLGVKHVIGCANGTEALMVALMALGLPRGSEVLTPDFTFVASAEAIALLGLVPILVDVDSETFNIDLAKARALVGPNTRAIMPVHLFGQAAPMHELLEMAQELDLKVIEDCAQSLGADVLLPDGSRRKAGTLGHIGCTSFYPSKNLGAYGDGGAIFTNDDGLAWKIRSISNHGMARERYFYDSVGVNSRLDALQAVVLSEKLKELDQYNQSRQQAADHYDRAFANHPQLRVPARHPASTHIFHQYTLVVSGADRDALKEHLQRAGVPSMVYYPKPLHEQEPYRVSINASGEFPVTDELCRGVLSLPMHTELDQEQLDYICQQVLSFFKD